MALHSLPTSVAWVFNRKHRSYSHKFVPLHPIAHREVVQAICQSGIRVPKCSASSKRRAPMYLSMIFGANFSSGSGPEIPLIVSLIIRFGGHVTTKKGTSWLFANEKGSHLWQTSPPPCSNGVAQTVPEAFLPPTVQRLSHCPAACPTSAAARHRVPDSRCGLLPQRHAKSRPRRRRGGRVRARSSWP
jgi:hypothetical protein